MEVYERVAKVSLKNKQTNKQTNKQQCGVVVDTFSLFSFSQIT